MTLDYVLSFESQPEVAFGHAAAAGHYSRFVANGADISYPAGRTGVCLRIVEGGAVATNIMFGYFSASQERCGVLYFRVPAAPSAISRMISIADAGANEKAYFNVNTAGEITATVANGVSQNGGNIAGGAWHRLDFWLTSSGTNWTLRWKIDGTAKTDATATGQVATDVRTISFGSGVTTHTLTFEIDDVLLGSDGTTEYPLVATYACGCLFPNADGTHNAGTNIMEDQAGNDIGVVTAFALVNEVPLDTGSAPADYIRQNDNEVTKYAEVEFDPPASGTILAVLGVECSCSVSIGQQGHGITRVVDSGGATLVDIIDAQRDSYTIRTAAARVPDPGGDGWTSGELSGVKMRVGFSNNASTYEPRWTSLFLEYAYTPVAVSRKYRVITSPNRW